MSTPQQKAKDVFVNLISNVEPEQWNARLMDVCGGDDEVRMRVKALLEAHRNPQSFLDKPAFDHDDTIQHSETIKEQAGSNVGPYKLLQHIGEGGMGVVFMAEQTHPVQRRVALKIVKPGMDTRQVIARFEAERQALALMDHPNIARVFDAGATQGGRPYFVMELVKGVPITKYCDERHLTPRERLELFVPVCQAVQHAHLKGVIHRDLKPSNVLIAAYDGKPVPKIIDFGVAKATGPKLTEKTMFTEFGSVIGTLEYMSPEQAELNQLDIDTRSDVYSLGVLLYELLTGSTPLEHERVMATALHEVLRFIREEEPPKPSTRLSTSNDLPAVASNRGTEPAHLQGMLSGELDWIVMKSLEKDRGRRYESTSALGADLERYLSNEVVQACPPSSWYRFRKMTRRNKAAIITTGLVVASLLVGTVISLWQMTVARSAEARARENLAEAVAAQERATRAEKLANERLESEQQARREKTMEANKATETSDLLRDLLGSTNPEDGKGAGYTVRQMLEDFSRDKLGQLANQPELAAELHLILGNAFRSLGLHDQAEPHLKAALELCRKVYGHDHAKVAEALSAYAHYYWEVGDFKAGESRAREALEIYKKLGIGNEVTINTLHSLQLALYAQSRYEEGLEILAEARKISQNLPTTPSALANVMHQHALMLSIVGDQEQAESVAREAVALHRQLHGMHRPETAWGFYLYGLILMSGDKPAEAESAFREALTVFSDCYDESHVNVRNTVKVLAKVLDEQDDIKGLADLTERYPWLTSEEIDFAVASTTLPVEVARGKTILFSVWIKTENVKGNAALWCRADIEDRVAAFSHLAERAPHGTTDWTRYELELGVPNEATCIPFGVVLEGSGRAWFDKLQVEVDGSPYTDDDLDLDFEQPVITNFYNPVRPHYKTALVGDIVKSGRQSLRMERMQPFPDANPSPDIPDSVLEEYAGRFEMKDQNLELIVRNIGGQLKGWLPGQRAKTLYPLSETEFAFGEGRIVFVRDGEGKVNEVAYSSVPKLIAYRIQPVEIDFKVLARYVGDYRTGNDSLYHVSMEEDGIKVGQDRKDGLRVFPISQNHFFYQDDLADIEFHENDKGEIDALTLYQDGQVIRAKRIGSQRNVSSPQESSGQE